MCGQDNPVHVSGGHLLLPAGSPIVCCAVYHCSVQVLTKLLPESVTSIERGRYHRDRFHEIRQKSLMEALMEAVFSVVRSLFILATVSPAKNGSESTDRYPLNSTVQLSTIVNCTRTTGATGRGTYRTPTSPGWTRGRRPSPRRVRQSVTAKVSLAYQAWLPCCERYS